LDANVAAMRDVASFRGCDVSNGQAITSTSGLHGTLNFSSRPSSSCSTRMPQIAENGNEGVEPNCVESRNLRNMPSFTPDFWDGSAISASRTASNNCEISFSTSNAMDIQVYIRVWVVNELTVYSWLSEKCESITCIIDCMNITI